MKFTDKWGTTIAFIIMVLAIAFAFNQVTKARDITTAEALYKVCVKNNEHIEESNDKHEVLLKFLETAAEARDEEAEVYRADGEKAKAKASEEVAAEYRGLVNKINIIDPIDCAPTLIPVK